MTFEDMKPRLKQLEADHGTVILLGLTGSHAHGLATPDSDEDWKGVFQARTTDVLCHRASESAAGHDPTDYQVHELDRFLQLASTCNPTMLELMWLDEYPVLLPAGEEILRARRSFLWTKPVEGAFMHRARKMAAALRRGEIEAERSEGVLASYKGFANRQLKGLAAIIEGRDTSASRRQEKHIRHMFRALDQARFILTTGDVQVRVPDRERLFELGRLDPERAVELAEAEIRSISKIKSVLPSQPDKDAINELRLKLRLDELDRSRN